MSAQKAIRYSVNLASEFQPPPPLFQQCAIHAFHMYIERNCHISVYVLFRIEWFNETNTTRLSVCWKNKFKQGKAVPSKLFLSIWCRGKRPRGRALVRPFTAPYFSVRPSSEGRASGFTGGSGRESRVFFDLPRKYREDEGISFLCHMSYCHIFTAARVSGSVSFQQRKHPIGHKTIDNNLCWQRVLF